MRIFNATVIILIAFLIFVVFPLYRGAYASSDLAGMWYSAFIGSIITYFLLTMQSKGMVERERQAAVFKERLDIYQNFLRKLCSIVEDRTLEDSEWMNLQFQLSYLAIHTNRKRMEIIQQNTFEILKTACLVEKRKDSGNNQNNQETYVTGDPIYMECLYEIVRQMQAQLYEKNDMKPLEDGLYQNIFIRNTIRIKRTVYLLFHDEKKHNMAWEDWKKKIHREFTGFDKVEPDNQEIKTEKEKSLEQSIIKHTVDGETLNEIRRILLTSPNNSESDEKKENKAKEDWKEYIKDKFPEWEFVFEAQGFQIRSVDKHNGHVGIRYNAASGLYGIFANYWKDGVNQSEFSRPMKWEFGGTRSYGAWSVPLNSKRMGITTLIEPSKLYTCLMSDAVKPILLEKMELIVDNLVKHNRTVEWIQALKNEGLNEKKWGVEAWYWDEMVCTALQDDPKFGTFRISVKVNEDDNKIELSIENTDQNREKLEEALKRLGKEKDISAIENGKLVQKEHIIDSSKLTDQIAKRVKEITNLIEKGA